MIYQHYINNIVIKEKIDKCFEALYTLSNKIENCKSDRFT